jgi:hypothetical protein
MHGPVRIALTASLLLVCSGPGHARKTASAIAITESSKTGALLIRVRPQPFDYQLTLQKEGSGGFGSRVYMVNVEPEFASGGEAWEARTLSAGRYVLKYVMQQKGWIGCLEDRTILFEIKPGSVNYLGSLDAEPILKLIQQAAGSRGDLTAGGGQGGGIYHDMVPPVLAHREAEDVSQARQFVETNMVKTRAPVILAPVEEYSFRTQDDRNRRRRACN